MVKLNRIGLLTVLLGLIVGGCTVIQKGTTQVKWEKGEKNDLVLTAIEDGNYALLRGSDYKPQFMVALRHGDPLGFKKGAEGKVVAVFGNQQREMDDANYYWNYRGK